MTFLDSCLRVYLMNRRGLSVIAGDALDSWHLDRKKADMLSMKRLNMLVLAVLFVARAAIAQDGSTVLNLDTGERISLRNIAGTTEVTNLESGEKIVVNGEFADELTDETYTEMMRRKSSIHLERLRSGEVVEAVPDLHEKSLVASGSYSVSGGTGGWETPLYYIQTSNVQVTIYGVCSRPGGDYVNVTLYKNVSWWLDTSYGVKSFYVDGNGETTTKTWSGVSSASYYYLLIDKAYNGYSAYGTYTIRD